MSDLSEARQTVLDLSRAGYQELLALDGALGDLEDEAGEAYWLRGYVTNCIDAVERVNTWAGGFEDPWDGD
jgi:hypothetical protein